MEVCQELRDELAEGCWREGNDENPLTAVLPIGHFDEITDDVHRVLSLLKNARPIFYTEIAKELELDAKYVHLILEVLADREFTEYGTSPRGSWVTEKGEQLLSLADEWKAKH